MAAAATTPENWNYINGYDEFDKLELQEINNALLDSLFEESTEECDDERLISVIRSLEAEIDGDVVDGPDLPTYDEWASRLESGEPPFDGRGCSTQSDLDVESLGAEMAEMNGWHVDPCGDVVDGLMGFDGGRDYSRGYYGVGLEESNGYGSLWQESHASAIDG